MLILGRKYRVKTHEELLASGWRWREEDECYRHREVSENLPEEMLNYSHVTFEDIVDGEWGTVIEDSGQYSWTQEMVVLSEPIKRNLPNWW